MGRLTNKYNLPDALYRAIANDPYKFTGNISVTQLIQPPQLRTLTIRHRDEIEEDITDKLWTLLGSAVHKVLERSDNVHAEDLQEVRIKKKFGEWEVSGQGDVWEAPDTLYDYKFTSVWASIGEIKRDWVWQLNMLANLYRYAGFPVNNLYIMAIFRDWSKNKAKQGGDYPIVGAKKIRIPLMKDEEIETLILERIKLHKNALELPDEELPECTPEETWEKPTTYAVMKNTNKRAVRVLENIDEATRFLIESSDKNPKDSFSLIKRPGERIRCLDYCPVNKFCIQYQKMIELEGACPCCP